MIAIIPARGGSKGLPDKNIRELNGTPLISYTIIAALKSKGIDRVIVSTDSNTIADIAKKYGADVPFIRPDYLADDNSSAIDVYLHAIEYVKNETGVLENKFMVLLPTAPLRSNIHIDEALELFNKKEASTLISITNAEVPIRWYLKKDENEYIHNAHFEEGKVEENRQNTGVYYIPNGAIYILDYNLLKNSRTYYDSNTIGYLMDREHSVDIDDILDFKIAELLVKELGDCK